jgi:hypothetical protein
MTDLSTETSVLPVEKFGVAKRSCVRENESIFLAWKEGRLRTKDLQIDW